MSNTPKINVNFQIKSIVTDCHCIFTEYYGVGQSPLAGTSPRNGRDFTGNAGRRPCVIIGSEPTASSRTSLHKYQSAPVHWNMPYWTRVASCQTLLATRIQIPPVDTIGELFIVLGAVDLGKKPSFIIVEMTMKFIKELWIFIRTIYFSAEGSGQQCCYDKNGFLMMSYDQMWGSRPLRSHDFGFTPYNEANKVKLKSRSKTKTTHSSSLDPNMAFRF